MRGRPEAPFKRTNLFCILNSGPVPFRCEGLGPTIWVWSPILVIYIATVFSAQLTSPKSSWVSPSGHFARLVLVGLGVCL